MILEKEVAFGVKQGLWITPWLDGWSAEKESADCPVRLFFILEDQHRAVGMVHQVIGVAAHQHPADGGGEWAAIIIIAGLWAFCISRILT